LRALAWEWREWCSFHYITDPESFFGGTPRYMLNVLLEDDDDDDDPRWRLLILEDTGELLTLDGRQKSGQGLSRHTSGIDARLVVVGMVSNGFSIADPNDPGMLDVVGFDTATPQLISDFARGAL
jgi:hypothetical protein